MNIEFDVYNVYPNLQNSPIPQIDKPIWVIGQFIERTLSHLKDEIEFEESKSERTMSIKCFVLEDSFRFSCYHYPPNLSTKVELALNSANLPELEKFLRDTQGSINN